MSHLVPDIVILGYGRVRTYQIKCKTCGSLFFPVNEAGEYTADDVFCVDCQCSGDYDVDAVERSPVPVVGNVVGVRQKAGVPYQKRGVTHTSKRNYALVYKRDNRTCRYCGYCEDADGGLRGIVIDHIKPFVAGGGNTPSNLVVACTKCNNRLADFWFDSFEDKKKYLEGKQNDG